MPTNMAGLTVMTWEEGVPDDIMDILQTLTRRREIEVRLLAEAE